MKTNDADILDRIILEKSSLISYSQTELSSIATSSNHLRGIINNQIDFNQSYLGGSYKRATMVKGISDVDIYFEYTGIGNPQTALTQLKKYLLNRYPNSIIKQDKPSIHVDFEKIPFNITPYKSSQWNNNTISIPNYYLSNWKPINLAELDVAITTLRRKNSEYIDLIKILKLWNRNYQRRIKNFEIERMVCNLFVYSFSIMNSISDWLWTFFQSHGYIFEAQKIHTLTFLENESEIKSEWSKFIDHK
jgi:hypothetical protein